MCTGKERILKYSKKKKNVNQFFLYLSYKKRLKRITACEFLTMGDIACVRDMFYESLTTLLRAHA